MAKDFLILMWVDFWSQFFQVLAGSHLKYFVCEKWNVKSCGQCWASNTVNKMYWVTCYKCIFEFNSKVFSFCIKQTWLCNLLCTRLVIGTYLFGSLEKNQSCMTFYVFKGMGSVSGSICLDKPVGIAFNIFIIQFNNRKTPVN